MIRVQVDSIRFSLLTQQRVVVLREINSRRYITIWIGPFEADAIALAVQGHEPPRPMTHDLLLAAMTSLKGEIREVLINDFHDSTFFARIHIEHEGRSLELDSRSSDAIALAVRAEVPIYVAAHVMDELGHMMDDQEDNEDIPTTNAQVEAEAAPTNDEEGLSIFRKFIDSIDSETPPDK
jgi:bifunctional DNase/RNase